MSSAPETNLELVHAAVEAYNRGDEAALMEFFHPEIESHVAPGLMNVGTWQGLDGYREMVEAWNEPWESQTMVLEVVEVTAPDDRHVLLQIHQTAVGSGSGVPVDMTVYYLIEIRDRKAIRFHIYPDRESALSAVR